MKLPVKSLKNKKIEDIEVSDSLFGARWNPDLVMQVVSSQRSNARSPWAHAKDRSDVRGGGKKPWRQKGTGRARHGSIRSPIWKGGGATHGPLKTRNYVKKVNKKMRRGAIASVLSKKINEEELKVIDSLAFDPPKTKVASESTRSFLKIPAKDKRTDVLFVSGLNNKTLHRVARNLNKAKVSSANSLNVIDLLAHKYVLFEKGAVEELEKIYARDGRENKS